MPSSRTAEIIAEGRRLASESERQSEGLSQTGDASAYFRASRTEETFKAATWPRLAAEVERLRAKLEKSEKAAAGRLASFGEVTRQLGACIERAEQAEAERDALREALEEFVYEVVKAGGYAVDYDFVEEARAALAKLKDKEADRG